MNSSNSWDDEELETKSEYSSDEDYILRTPKYSSREHSVNVERRRSSRVEKRLKLTGQRTYLKWMKKRFQFHTSGVLLFNKKEKKYFLEELDKLYNVLDDDDKSEVSTLSQKIAETKIYGNKSSKKGSQAPSETKLTEHTKCNLTEEIDNDLEVIVKFISQSTQDENIDSTTMNYNTSNQNQDIESSKELFSYSSGNKDIASPIIFNKPAVHPNSDSETCNFEQLDVNEDIRLIKNLSKLNNNNNYVGFRGLDHNRPVDKRPQNVNKETIPQKYEENNFITSTKVDSISQFDVGMLTNANFITNEGKLEDICKSNSGLMIETSQQQIAELNYSLFESEHSYARKKTKVQGGEINSDELIYSESDCIQESVENCNKKTDFPVDECLRETVRGKSAELEIGSVKLHMSRIEDGNCLKNDLFYAEDNLSDKLQNCVENAVVKNTPIIEEIVSKKTPVTVIINQKEDKNVRKRTLENFIGHHLVEDNGFIGDTLEIQPETSISVTLNKNVKRSCRDINELQTETILSEEVYSESLKFDNSQTQLKTKTDLESKDVYSETQLTSNLVIQETQEIIQDPTVKNAIKPDKFCQENQTQICLGNKNKETIAENQDLKTCDINEDARSEESYNFLMDYTAAIKTEPVEDPPQICMNEQERSELLEKIREKISKLEKATVLDESIIDVLDDVSQYVKDVGNRMLECLDNIDDDEEGQVVQKAREEINPFFFDSTTMSLPNQVLDSQEVISDEKYEQEMRQIGYNMLQHQDSLSRLVMEESEDEDDIPDWRELFGNT